MQERGCSPRCGVEAGGGNESNGTWHQDTWLPNGCHIRWMPRERMLEVLDGHWFVLYGDSQTRGLTTALFMYLVGNDYYVKNDVRPLGRSRFMDFVLNASSGRVLYALENRNKSAGIRPIAWPLRAGLVRLSFMETFSDMDTLDLPRVNELPDREKIISYFNFGHHYVQQSSSEFQHNASLNLQWYLNSTRLPSGAPQLLLFSTSVQTNDQVSAAALARNQHVLDQLWSDNPELQARVTRIDRLYTTAQRPDQLMWNHYTLAVQFWDVQRLLPYVAQHLNGQEHERWLQQDPVECAQAVEYTRKCRVTDEKNSSYGVHRATMRGFFEWYMHCEYTISSCTRDRE